MARLRHGTTTAIGVLVDVATWGSGRGGGTRTQRRPASVQLDSSALLLRRSGWRVLTAASGSSLPALWPQIVHVGSDDRGAVSRPSVSRPSAGIRRLSTLSFCGSSTWPKCGNYWKTRKASSFRTT